MLVIEPVDVAVMSPKGDVSRRDTGMAKLFEVFHDIVVTETAAEHAVDDLADLQGKAGDLTGAGAGRGI